MPLETLFAPVLNGPGEFFPSNVACSTLRNCRLYQAFFLMNFFAVVAYKRMSLIREMSVYYDCGPSRTVLDHLSCRFVCKSGDLGRFLLC